MAYLSLIDIFGEYEGVVRREWGAAWALFVCAFVIVCV